MSTLITGATGFLGRALVPLVDDPVILTRDPAKARELFGPVRAWAWEPESGPPQGEALEGVDAVINLAGEPVAQGRWSAARKARIRDSRVVGTRHLVQGLAAMEVRPRVLVSGSAVGYYGSRGDEVLEEAAAPGGDFLARVCLEWEAEARAAEALGVRVVLMRTGLVLGPGGGALERIAGLFRRGLGGRLGRGDQWMPWISRQDLVRALVHSMKEAQVRGPVNGVSPNPVTNRDFTGILAGALNKRAFLPAPAPALRLALGEMAGMLLASQRALPGKLSSTGFRFQDPVLSDLLVQLLG